MNQRFGNSASQSALVSSCSTGLVPAGGVAPGVGFVVGIDVVLDVVAGVGWVVGIVVVLDVVACDVVVVLVVVLVVAVLVVGPTTGVHP